MTNPQTSSKTSQCAVPVPLVSKTPWDSNAALRQIMATIHRLEEIYTKETQALDKTDSNAFLALQDEKLAITREYQIGMGELSARQDELKQADPQLRKKLKTLYINFEEVARQNLESIERMCRCTERLSNTLRNAAIQTAMEQRTYSYGENGTIPASARSKAVSSGLSETA